MADRVHYIADITVRRVTLSPPQTGRYAGDPTTPEKKSVATIAHIITSNEELDKLVEKTGLHLGLVEDGGDIEKGGATR